MNKANIVVIGSSNTDMVIRSAKIPVPGESVMGNDFFMCQGGKGANQAVAAVRMGANVTFVAKLGNDLFGKNALQSLKDESIDTEHILLDRNSPSGVAMINVDAKGENAIVVAPGSNNKLGKADVDKAFAQADANSIFLTQLETPIETVEYIAEKVAQAGKKIILNPAPARELSISLLKNLYLITPNETEAEILTGIKITDIQSIELAAKILVAKGVKNVIITLGSKGAFVLTEDYTGIIPSYNVNVVDSTAAGDTFNGALVVGLAEGMSIKDAVKFGNCAACISVQALGAQTSIPKRAEVDKLFNLKLETA